LALVLAFLSGLRGVAQAEDGSQYRTVITSALDEYELGNYEEARSLFERAHAIEPSARTLRGMGMAAYQARKYVIAIGYLQASLVDQRKPLTTQFRREVQSALEAAQGFVVHFDLLLTPSEARVMLDGEPIEGHSRVLQLDPGEHEIVATAPGYKTDSRRIKASPGRRGRVELELSPEMPALAGTHAAEASEARATAPDVKPQAGATAPDVKPRVPIGFRVLAGTGLSLALAGAVVGTVAGIKALNQEDKLHDACPDKTCDTDQATRLNDAKTWGTISTVTLAVGGAGLAAGVVGLVLWIQRTRTKQDLRSHARLTPIVLGSGLGVQGNF
jgi:hypothetical protein